MIRIPFNRPRFVGREQEYIAAAIAAGHVSGDGEFTLRCQALLEQELGAAKVLLTTSCTHALELAALLLDIVPGDEVIVPDFTFVSTANAFVLRGARPRFADIDPATLNVDPVRIAERISARTKAIVPVHYGGVGCDMRAIGELAAAKGITVIEDNAHGLFGKRDGRWLGTFGAMSTLSFHETKNFFCGEGGALVINDPRYVERAEILREKGTNRKRFFRGLVDKYTWVDVGSSFLPSDILAAFLFAQLEQRDWVMRRRREVYERYASGLAGWAAANGVRLPVIPAGCDSSWHMFFLIMPSAESRDALIAHLRMREILAVFHYLPLSRSPMGQRLSAGDRCPVSETVSARLVRLPFFNTLLSDEHDEVIAAVTQFRV